VSKNLDLNKASEQELAVLQGMNRDNARKIVDFRNLNGHFNSWEDLKRIPGLPGNTLDILKRHGCTVAGMAA
jgi:competence ComEA-like helix-hairpin-helix protein